MANFASADYPKIKTYICNVLTGAELNIDINHAVLTYGCMSSSGLSFGISRSTMLEINCKDDTWITKGRQFMFKVCEGVNLNNALFSQAFIISSFKKDGRNTCFTAYGCLESKLKTKYSYNVRLDFWGILNRIREKTGIAIDIVGSDLQQEIKTAKFPTQSGKIHYEELGYTNRQMLEYVAGAFGCNVYEMQWQEGYPYGVTINRDFLPLGYKGHRVVEIDKYVYANGITGGYRSGADRVQINRLVCTTTTAEIGGVEKPAATVERTIWLGDSEEDASVIIEFNNPYVNEDLLANIYEKVAGTSYTSATVSCHGGFMLFPGDYVSVYDQTKTYFQVHGPACNIVTTIKGGIKHDITVAGGESGPIGGESSSSTTRIINALAIEAVENKSDYENFKDITAEKIDTINLSVTGKLDANEAEIRYASIEIANILKANIDTLSGSFLSFKTGEFETLKTMSITTDNVSAKMAQLGYVTANEIDAKIGTFGYLKADELEAELGEFGYLTTEEAEIQFASIQNLNSAVATIENLSGNFLSFKTGDFDVLKAKMGDISTLLFGSATGNVLTSQFSTAVISNITEAIITNAMINDLSAGKITSGAIYTNLVDIVSDSGNFLLRDNTIQIKDATRTRVQIGKDASNDYNMYIWDKNGQVMFDALGLTDKGITRQIIRDDMVSTTANINASKLNISSLFSQMNASSEVLKASRIQLDTLGQSLDVAFTTTTTTANSALSNSNLAISTANSADAKIDGLTIGGRNLIKDSNWTITATKNNFASTVGASGAIVPNYNLQSLIGKTLTLSFFVHTKGDGENGDGGLGGRWGIHGSIVWGNDSSTYMTEYPFTNFLGNYNIENQRVSMTWTVIPPEGYTIIATFSLSIQPFKKPANNNNETWILANPKLEIGNKATDWTPAPEDIDSSIDDLSTTITTQGTSISAIQGQISQKVWQNDINIATGEINSRLASIDIQLTGINMSVSDVQSRYDNLTIGGRNLLRNSSFNKSLDSWGSYPSSGTITVVDGYSANKAVQLSRSGYSGSSRCCIQSSSLSHLSFSKGEILTISAWVKVTTALSAENNNIMLRSNLGDIPQITVPSNTMLNKWMHFKNTYTLTADMTPQSVFALLGVNGTMLVSCIKLEKGNKATDWTPAPEDTQAQIDSATASIALNTTNIALKVGKNDVISSINQSAEAITINANKINLTGAVTISALAQDTKTSLDSAISTANSALTLVSVQDTRSANENPQWYMSNYPKKTVREFKTSSVIGLSGSTYCTLETYIPWHDSSGGYPTQTAYLNTTNTAYKRVGTSGTSWSAWVSVDKVIADWCYSNNTTYIDGGKIYTGTITADKIDVNDLFSRNITATGTISGVTLQGAKGTIAGWNINSDSLSVGDAYNYLIIGNTKLSSSENNFYGFPTIIEGSWNYQSVAGTNLHSVVQLNPLGLCIYERRTGTDTSVATKLKLQNNTIIAPNGLSIETGTGGVNIGGNLRLKNNTNYGCKLNFGDGDYVYLYEVTDDKLQIKANAYEFLAGSTVIATANSSGFSFPLSSAMTAQASAKTTTTTDVTSTSARLTLSSSALAGNTLSISGGGIYVSQTGYYQVSASVHFNTTTADNDSLYVAIFAGSTQVARSHLRARGNYNSVAVSPRFVYITQGTTVYLSAVNSTRTGQPITGGADSTYLTIVAK